MYNFYERHKIMQAVSRSRKK